MIPVYKETDFDEIDRIFLFLGPACNLHCRHCQQIPLHKFNFDNIKYNDRILSVFENFLRYRLSHRYNFAGIHKDTPVKKPFYISFWGGEPLLYWSFIKKAVLYLYERLELDKVDDFCFFITTNGTLLSDEIIDFCNRYRIKVHLSYDAPYPFSARDYVPDEVCEKVRKIKGYGIASCYSAYNCDYLLMFRCLKAKFPDGQIKIHHRLSRNSLDMPKDIYDFDWDKIRLSIRRLVIGAKCGDRFSVQWIRGRYLNNILYPGEYRSVTRKHSLYMDLSGNFIFHKNLPNIVVGTVYDSLRDVFLKYDKIKEERSSPICMFCRHKDVCTHSQNWSDIKNKNGVFISCEDYYLKFYDIIKEDLKLLGHPLTQEELLWFKGQEVLMEKDIQRFLNEGNRYLQEHNLERR